MGPWSYDSPSPENQNAECQLDLAFADGLDLKKFDVLSKDKAVDGSSLRRWILTIIILCIVVSGAFAEALAQDAAATSEDSTSGSLVMPRTNKGPKLVIGMTERENEAMDPRMRNAIARELGSTSLSDRAEKTESALFLSNFPALTTGILGLTTFSEQSLRETVRQLSSPSGTEVHSLLGDRQTLESLLYENPTGYRPSKR